MVDYMRLDTTVERVRVTATRGKRAELQCRSPTPPPLPGTSTVVAEWKFSRSEGGRTSRVALNRYVMLRYQRRFALKSSNVSDDEAEIDFSLVIRAASRRDVGVYVCVVSDDRTFELRRFVHLDVVGSCII